jgi:phenylalanyl-tRNA synthetase alpha chain
MKMRVRKNGVSDFFKAVGIGSEELIGFAFDLGLERVAMRKYSVGDIRLLFENDARFLRQF